MFELQYYTVNSALNQRFLAGMPMQSTEITMHGFVSGRVQGVFFRVETQKMAVKLGLRGWVRNTADGRVETLICGSNPAVESMVRWLGNGPPLAKVNSLELEPVNGIELTGFQIRP